MQYPFVIYSDSYLGPLKWPIFTAIQLGSPHQHTLEHCSAKVPNQMNFQCLILDSCLLTTSANSPRMESSPQLPLQRLPPKHHHARRTSLEAMPASWARMTSIFFVDLAECLATPIRADMTFWVSLGV